MKLELERSEFLKAWQTAEKYTPSKTTMEAINGVKITADKDDSATLEATNLKTSVKCSAKGVLAIEPGSAVLNAELFGNMLKKSNAQTITLEVNQEKGILKAGKSKSRFTVIKTDLFPKIPESNNAELICEIMASDLGGLINEGSCAASAPSDFPKYMGTCLLRTEGQYMISVSTDGKRLARSKKICISINKDNEDLLLPAAALKDLGKIFNSEETVKIFADDSTVWFTLDSSEFSIRRIDAAFPKYEHILNNEVKTSVKISKKELLSSLERIDVIAKNIPGHLMAMELKPDNEIRITSRAQEQGTISDSLEAIVEGQPMQIGFNLVYLQDGIKAVSTNDVLIEFSDEEGQTRLLKDEGDDFLYMLMPVRLSPQDLVNDDDNSDSFISQPEEPEEPEYNENENNEDAPF